MYLSRKNRPADITNHEMVKLYEQEHRNTLAKMGTITHEVEQVAKILKTVSNSSANEKQLALEKLVRILDALNTLRYEQRDLLRKPDDSKTRYQEDVRSDKQAADIVRE